MSRKTPTSIHRPKTEKDFRALHRSLTRRGYIALDVIKPGKVRDISLAVSDAATAGAQDMASTMDCGTWSNGPLSKVAWSFDGRKDTIEQVKDKDGNTLGLGYVKWGSADNIPNVIPPLAMSSPYTAAPLRYISDLTTGLGVRYMFRMPDGKLVEFKDAGLLLQQMISELEEKETTANPVEQQLLDDGLVAVGAEPRKRENGKIKLLKDLYADWERTWYGYDDENTHIVSAKKFLEDNNLDLHLITCEQDDPYLDIYFPTVGLERGRRGQWRPGIVQISTLPAHSCRLERMNEYRHINHVYFSDSLRTRGAALGTAANAAAVDQSWMMYPCAMPQQMLSDLRYIVDSNQRTRISARPTWVVCPTFYPSGNKPYYPQPHWWSVFTSKAFDFSATILYDKYKARENSTTWGRIIYISLDYLEQVFSDDGYQGNGEKQQQFIDNLDDEIENFLQHRDNHGKTMRQWMWLGQDGKQHKNVEIVDISETKSDAIKAGKDELEMSTNPIFLALQVDPRDVGVPMVAASNGGTALREIRLMKQQQLNPKQRLYLNFMNDVARFNQWSERGEFHILQQTFTTLDASKTGTKDTIAGEGA